MQALSLLLPALLLSSLCSASNYTQKDLNEERVTASNWQQLSPEYDALMYQTFNIASDQLQTAIENTPDKKKPVLVADIDETLLEGATYFSNMIGTHESKSIERSLEWWNSRKFIALPGAREFISRASSLGMEIFYISGRFDEVKEKTMISLTEAGFPVASKQHLLLQPTLNKSQSKTDRRKIIQDKGYYLSMLIGDHLEDLGSIPKGHYSTRKHWVSDHKNHYGKDWFTLPNMAYGSWLNPAGKSHSKLSPEEAHSANIEAIADSWFSDIKDHNLSHQSIAASVWQHASAEYDALAYQAFNQGKHLIKKTTKPTTVVIDINGSLLEFLPEYIFPRSQFPASQKNLSPQLASKIEKSHVIPGSLDFIHAANKAGIKLFYLSELPLNEDTILKKLERLGLPQLTRNSVITQEEYCSDSSDCDISRIKALITDNIQGKGNRILIVSDSLDDLSLIAPDIDPDNKDSIARKKELFGREFLLIPNPLDQRRMDKILNTCRHEYQGQSQEMKAKIRKQLLKRWGQEV